MKSRQGRAPSREDPSFLGVSGDSRCSWLVAPSLYLCIRRHVAVFPLCLCVHALSLIHADLVFI